MEKKESHRLPRKQKKKIRVILLLHTGNLTFKKLKISKKDWVNERKFYSIWFNCFDMTDRKSANQFKRYHQ